MNSCHSWKEKEMIREGLDTLEEDESQMDAVETVGDPGSGAAVVQEQSNQRQNAGPSTIVNPAGTRAPIPRKRKMSALDKKKEAMFDSVQNLLSATEAEWEVIGKSLGLQLSQLNNDQQTIAQKLISDYNFLWKA
ncbi:uncharacterized protein LOC124374700 [Homalodisca vitripennis]|uniref:uncharacterized protein LOC124374700 n=1 Tax=Homalodisca vitripennis TaxID=197043 RepID=UPI001EEBC009|nr:uncharacterized protein LOC124374700 [Homalodisca vitripennis]